MFMRHLMNNKMVESLKTEHCFPVLSYILRFHSYSSRNNQDMKIKSPGGIIYHPSMYRCYQTETLYFITTA